MWFLGISCAPVMDDSDDNNTQREIAELQAKAEVMFSLYADAKSSKKLETLTQTKVGANGAKEYQTLEDYSKEQSESFNNIMISGNNELYSGTVRHAPSGLDTQVVVYGVNSGNAKTLKDIKTRATELGIEVNTAQESIRGEQNRLKERFDVSKDNPDARNRGARGADADLKKKQEERAKARAKWGTGFKQTGTVQDAKTKGELKTGAQTIVDDEEEP